MTDIVERLRNQLNAANRRGLSIPGDPAWAIEQCNRAHARTRLNEKIDEWLPELLAEIASLRAERDAQADTIATLQAKLDKAVEGLERIVKRSDHIDARSAALHECRTIAQSLIKELRP